jgi:hypothetical protein
VGHADDAASVGRCREHARDEGSVSVAVGDVVRRALRREVHPMDVVDVAIPIVVDPVPVDLV